MARYLCVVLGAVLGAFLLASCGNVSTQTNTFQPQPNPNTSPTPEPAAVVHVSDFFSAGILTVVEDLDNVGASDVSTNVTAPLPHTDAILRSFSGLVYVVNRLGRDSIQVVDPELGFDTILEFSTGAGTNPHDILVLSPSKAYVLLYEPEAVAGRQELMVVNPSTGAILKQIDLTLFTDDDGERLARPERMIKVGQQVWILLQDLSSSFIADTNGKIAVIDSVSDSYVDADPLAVGIQGIALEGRNPSSLAYDASNGWVFVSMTGVFQPDFSTDTADPYGGIEAVDPDTYTSFGIVVDDADLGGYPWGIQVHSSGLAFTTADSKRVASFNPSNFAVLQKNLYASPGTFLPEILLDGEGHLLVTERGDLQGQDAGLIILDITDNFSVQGPIDVGGPPNSLAVVEW